MWTDWHADVVVGFRCVVVSRTWFVVWTGGADVV